MLPIDTPDNLFHDGDPLTGTLGTPVLAAWLNAVQQEVLSVTAAANLEPSADNTQLLQAIRHLFPPAVSIFDIPDESIGPAITVIEAGEVWPWVETAYFTGYRSPLCGRPLDGHTVTPLPSEIDVVGGLLSKTAYARVWAYAQENSLVVTQAVWTANIGAHYFVDVDANNFRTPDLRNMFRRYTGTDADTANARALGTRQSDALQNLTGYYTLSANLGAVFSPASIGGAFAPGGVVAQLGLQSANSTTGYALTFDASRVARTSTETRPTNTAFLARIHV